MKANDKATQTMPERARDPRPSANTESLASKNISKNGPLQRKRKAFNASSFFFGRVFYICSVFPSNKVIVQVYKTYLKGICSQIEEYECILM